MKTINSAHKSNRTRKLTAITLSLAIATLTLAGCSKATPSEIDGIPPGAISSTSATMEASPTASPTPAEPEFEITVPATVTPSDIGVDVIADLATRATAETRQNHTDAELAEIQTVALETLFAMSAIPEFKQPWDWNSPTYKQVVFDAFKDSIHPDAMDAMLKQSLPFPTTGENGEFKHGGITFFAETGSGASWVTTSTQPTLTATADKYEKSVTVAGVRTDVIKNQKTNLSGDTSMVLTGNYSVTVSEGKAGNKVITDIQWEGIDAQIESHK